MIPTKIRGMQEKSELRVAKLISQLYELNRVAPPARQKMYGWARLFVNVVLPTAFASLVTFIFLKG